MLTIALSFLIFAGSSFDLIGHLIIGQLEARIGADFYATTYTSPGFLDELGITKFLE